MCVCNPSGRGRLEASLVPKPSRGGGGEGLGIRLVGGIYIHMHVETAGHAAEVRWSTHYSTS